MILGVILLFLFNLFPFFKIPINILTILVAGFGGVIGFGLLIVAKALGFY
ncbi:MAG: pro-sigmaK processing inhibitor BofA family protein [Methanobacteriaceae archaeon]